MYRIGVDVGSTYTKYCVLDSDNNVLELYSEKTPVKQREYFKKKFDGFRLLYNDIRIVSCGYGRGNIGADYVINELTALAIGVYHLTNQSGVIVDIGGQDTKIITQERGKLREFFLNDKCAAGCGMFFENTLKMLQIGYEDVHVTGIEHLSTRLSSVCAVFAQSEIVQLIAENKTELECVQAVLWHIFVQAKNLVGKVKTERVFLTGGLTEIEGIFEFAENVWSVPVVHMKDAKYAAALGCALYKDDKK